MWAETTGAIVASLGVLSGLFLWISKKPKDSVPSQPPEVTLGDGCSLNEEDEFDVIIVGAGISGISAAHALQEKCPNKVSVDFSSAPAPASSLLSLRGAQA